MRIVIHPVVDPRREVDLTNRLISAIADELSRLYGGNEQLNWLEAERHLGRIVDEARAAAAEARASFGSQASITACPGCPKRRAKPAGSGGAGGASRAGIPGPRPSSLAVTCI